MPNVTVNGRDIEIQRFPLAKASRIITLLQKIQQTAPGVTAHYARFTTEYANSYPKKMTRMQAVAMFGPMEHISEDLWERDGQTFTVPGSPSPYEVFFEMAPMLYDAAEELVLRLLAVVAMPNEVFVQKVETGELWGRVDAFVDDVIRPADIGELAELVVVAAEVIDTTIIQRIQKLGEKAGNVARLLGIKTPTPGSGTESRESSEQHVETNTVTVGGSPSSEDGPPEFVSDSPSTSSLISSTSTQTTLTPPTVAA